jgi:DNA-directed RNA polymerase specialized sigma24 family protein
MPATDHERRASGRGPCAPARALSVRSPPHACSQRRWFELHGSLGRTRASRRFARPSRCRGALPSGARSRARTAPRRVGLLQRLEARLLSRHERSEAHRNNGRRPLNYRGTFCGLHGNAVAAWLVTTACRERLRILRAKNRERPTDDELLLDTTALPVDEEILRIDERRAAERRDAERAAGLAMAREQLPGRQRQLVFMLLADTTPSYAEISHALGMPIGSIGPARERSLARLRQNENLGGVDDDYVEWRNVDPEHRADAYYADLAAADRAAAAQDFLRANAQGAPKVAA